MVNLRGTLEAGLIFSLPTYLFVASLGGVLLFGVIKTLVTGGSPVPVVAPPPLSAAGQTVTLWLLLRAFASGCTAMTGVEAVSNGVSAFRDPTVKHAHRTLTGIVLILALLLAVIAYLAPAYGIGAMDQTQPGYQSVLSQLAGAIVGRGVIYFTAIGSVLAVLCLSANTSFVDFPRVCRLVAQDGYLPRSFAMPGRRLVYSVGILWLAATAGLLLTIFAEIEAEDPGRPVFVLIPEVVKEHWWDYLLLDSSRIRRLRAALLRHGGPNLAVVTVPWAREEPHPEEVIAEEEPQSQKSATTAPQPA